MPKISPIEFYAVPLRVHTFLAGVPLHDSWAVDLPACGGGITLAEFLRRNNQGEIVRLPIAARALFRFRLFLGRIFRLETEPTDALAGAWLFSRRRCQYAAAGQVPRRRISSA